MPLDGHRKPPAGDADLRSLLPEPAVSRRRFVAGAAAASGLALAVRPARATMIRTDADGLRAGMVDIPVADGRLPAYAARPASGSGHPAILVVQEIFGVHEHIRDVCRRLAKAGHFAIAPALYHRQGDPSKYTFKEIRRLISEIVARVPDRQVMSDLDHAAKYAGRNGGDVSKLAVTGFCWGGRIVWMYAAHNPDLKAGVAWYGRVAGRGSNPNTPSHPVDVAARIRAPVLGLYGGRDRGIPIATVRDLEARIRAAGNARVEIVVYPEAPHGFHADYRPSYREEAARDGWKRLRGWLKEHGAA